MNCQNKAVTVASATTTATNMTTLFQKNCMKTLPGNNVIVMANGTPLSTTPTTFLAGQPLGQPLVGVLSASGARLFPTPEQQQFQYQNNQQQFIVYNNEVTTMYRSSPIQTNIGTLYNSQEQHLNNQQTQLHQQQQQFETQQISIPKPLGSVIHSYTPHITPTTSSYEHIENGYIGSVLPGSTETSSITNSLSISSSMSSASHPTTKTIYTTKALPSNGIGSSQLNSMNLIKQNGITTDDRNVNHTTTAANDVANNSINVNTIQTNSTGADARQTDGINDIVPSADIVEEVTASDATPSEVGGNQGNATDATEQEPEPEIDIVINNVVCSFSVRCHLNLREIALNGRNVEFRRENGMVTMKLRRPYTTASIWSSGRITCTGATSEDQAKVGARRYARCLQELGFPVRFNNFRVVNVLGTCSMPWGINIINFSERFKKDASYEPELHPGVTYKLKIPKATLKIFSTGSITVTAGSVAHVQAAIEHIYPLIYEFRKKRLKEPVTKVEEPIKKDIIEVGVDDTSDLCVGKRKRLTNAKAIKRKYPFGLAANDPTEDNMYVSEDDDDDDDIDEEN